MRFLRLSPCALAALVCLAAFAGAARAEVRIRDDNGGAMSTYLQTFTRIRESKQQVVIDGNCYSACTLVTAVVPASRICVTPRAELGFHVVNVENAAGDETYSRGLSQALLALYPDAIRAWIDRHGGLTSRLLIMRGSDLLAFYRPCP